MMSWARARQVQIIWIPALILMCIALPLIARSSLPDPVAVHWNIQGEPDGAMPLAPVVATMAGVWLLLWVYLFKTDRVGAPSPGGQTVMTLGLMMAYVSLLIVERNMSSESWTHAGPLPWYAAAPPLLAVAVLGVWLVDKLERSRAQMQRDVTPATALPSLGLAAGEKAVWRNVTRARAYRYQLIVWVIALGLLVYRASTMAPRATDVAPGSLIWFMAVSGVILLVGLAFMAIEVTVTSERVTVRSAILRVPFRKLQMTDIASARVEEIRPVTYGGWGYRLRKGTGAVVIRRGEGIYVNTRQGRDFAVTVDDAEQAAGLINDLSSAERARG